MKMCLKNSIRSAVLSVGVTGLACTTALADMTLTFGTYAADKPTEVVRQFKPFLNYLSEDLSRRLGEPVKVRMKISKGYQESIDELTEGNVDFARFGPASYISAKTANPDISIVAMESKKGKKRFKGIIAVHADSGFESLEDLRDQSFAFGNELSTIGRYLSQSHLLDAGISGSDLARFEYLGRHDLVGTSVGNKSFAAGALKESTFKKLQEKEVPIKALYKFDNVTKPWLAKSGLSEEVIEAMRASMMSDEGAAAVKEIAKNGFLLGSDNDYDFIRKAMNHSEAF